MALAYRRDESGLVLAEEAVDEARLSRALKLIDDRLVLQKERFDCPGGWRYRVLRVWSDEHPATHLFWWADEYGTPLPLTSGILDKVHVHLLGFRGNEHYLDEDAHNTRHLEQLDRMRQEAHDATVEEHAARLAGRVSVSMSRAADGRRRLQRDDTPDAPTSRRRP